MQPAHRTHGVNVITFYCLPHGGEMEIEENVTFENDVVKIVVVVEEEENLCNLRVIVKPF